MNYTYKLPMFIFTTAALTGCDEIINSMNKSGDSFTLKGNLPAEFGIDAIAFYTPLKPNTASCQAQTLEPGKTVTRRYAYEYSADFKNEPQAFSFDIPLNHTKKSCAMKLLDLRLAIRGRHGQQNWQSSYADGALYFFRYPTSKTVAFDANGTYKMNGKCRWSFQQSVARSRPDEIEKLLDCGGTGAYIAFDQINNKTIVLEIEVSPEERPSERNTWIKFPVGWKPCAHQGDWRWCREPVSFKTFKMNGKTCTVYPNCTE